MKPTLFDKALLALAVFIISAGDAVAETYRLGVSDVVRIKVVEWLAADGLFRDWSEVSGEYAVGPDGLVAMPLLGEIPAQSKSTAELAAEISAGLREVLALQGAPDVTVEIAKFGPVYVAGDVKTPGAYPFAPGLTVIKALTLAGGEGLGSAVLSTDRDLITTEGNYRVLREQQLRLIAKRARLDAELAGETEVAIPPQLAEADGAGLIGFEQAILVANQRRASVQQTALDDLITLLNREIETLEQKKETVTRQLESARKDLTDVRSLADDGLAINSRVSALEQSVAALESSLLDIDTATLRARQDISDAERDGSNLVDTRFAELTLARQQADAEIAELDLRMATQQALIGDIGASADGAESEVAFTYLYTIIRGTDEIPADATTAVAPGDVVRVTLQSGDLSSM